MSRAPALCAAALTGLLEACSGESGLENPQHPEVDQSQNQTKVCPSNPIEAWIERNVLRISRVISGHISRMMEPEAQLALRYPGSELAFRNGMLDPLDGSIITPIAEVVDPESGKTFVIQCRMAKNDQSVKCVQGTSLGSVLGSIPELSDITAVTVDQLGGEVALQEPVFDINGNGAEQWHTLGTMDHEDQTCVDGRDQVCAQQSCSEKVRVWMEKVGKAFNRLRAL